MSIFLVTERTFQRALLQAAGIVLDASVSSWGEGHLGPKSGKSEYFCGDTLRVSRDLGNPEEGS